MMTPRRSALWFLWGIAACTNDTVLVRDEAEGGTATGMDAGVVPDAGIRMGDGGVVFCGPLPCACSNGDDDDSDGLVDGFDPECTGPFDNDEASFATGIPGDNRNTRCQDCFFDGNSGSGDDGCRVAPSCLTEGTGGNDRGACDSCDVSSECLNSCRPRTPNGCDCFGCCEVVLPAGGAVNVLLDSTCSIENIDDEDRCRRCIQSPSCLNTCERCELCPGRAVDDLPADCQTNPGGGAPPYSCADGEQPCDGTTTCPLGFYCQQGCCLEFVF